MTDITAKPIGDVVADYMTDYGLYVNMDRAIPDSRDGLKPVHRRLLVSMADLKVFANMRKSATVIGHALGNYHPHGDSAAYGALVGLSHRRYPLIATRGNWGIGNCGVLIENAAAYRYTECRLSALGKYLLAEGDICDQQPNFDGSRTEPVVLSARIPLLLMNGAEGIGVAARTSIPPHNLRELARALRWVIRRDSKRFRVHTQVRPYRAAMKLARMVPGPDYNTGILLSSRAEVAKLYATGKGTLRYRCEYHFEEAERGKQMLVVDKLAPGFSVPRFLVFCAEEAEAGHIVSAESDADLKGNITVKVKFRDAGPVFDRIIPKLQTSVSYQLTTVLCEGAKFAGDDAVARPKQHGMAPLMLEYIDHQRDIEARILRRDIAKAEKDRARLDAVVKAFKKLAAFTKLLQKKHADDASLVTAVCKLLKVAPEPAESLLRMQIRSLSATNVGATEERIKALADKIEEWQGDLSDIDQVLLRRLDEAVEAFGDDRGTLLPEQAVDPELAADSPSKVMLLKWRKGRKRPNTQGAYHVTRPPLEGRTSIQQLFKGRRKIDADEILQVGDEFYIVYSDGLVRTVRWAYIKDGKHAEWNRDGVEIVKFISDRDDLILAADGKGKVAVVKANQRQDTYQIAKLDKVVSAIGLRRGEHAAVYEAAGGNIKAKGRYRSFEWWEKRAKRKGSLPSRVLPHARLCGLLRLPKGAIVLREDVSGRPIPVHSSPKRLSAAEAKGCHVVFEDSLVIFEDGRKRQRPWHRVRSAIRRGEGISHILPMQAWEHTISGLDADSQEEIDADAGEGED